MLKTYYYLTKPGIIYGNAITAITGFFLASKGQIDLQLLLATLAGLAFVIASGCVFNNLFDRDIDSQMERTKNRAIVTGIISKQSAVIFGTALGICGVLILYLYTNPLTLSVASAGWFIYLALYTPLKRRTIHATLIGALAGATPPVVGYTAVLNQFDMGAILLFLILVAWQMPHFYAIAIRRRDEYTEASIPVLPVKKGIRVTKIYIIIYILIYIIETYLLFAYSYVGLIYLTITSLLGLLWLWFGIKGLRADIDDKEWAKKMFKFSLVVLLILSITISLDSLLKN